MIAMLGPWRSACDVIDAPPRSFDLVVVAGICLLLIAMRIGAAWRERRRSR